MKITLELSELVELVRETFKYDSTTGNLYWKCPSKYNPWLGSQLTGSLHKSGYLHTNWLGRSWKTHQLVWLYCHGTYPIGVIDHKNGKRLDNRIENLRDASLEENRQNVKKAQKNNKLQVLGVQARGSKFRARIRHNGVLHNLGTFALLEDAVSAYKEAKKLLHKGYIDEDHTA